MANNPQIESIIKSWIPNQSDFSFGRALIISEDYSKTIEKYPKKDFLYGALLYSILSHREKFNQHKRQFNEFLSDNLRTAESIIKNKEKVEEILKKYGCSNIKIPMVFSTAEQWNDLNLTERIRNDERKNLGFLLREEIVKKMFGVGYKFASLFLRMSGYENIVPVDTWATQYVESRGFRDRSEETGLKPKQYLKYEKKITKYAKKFNVSPALFQATIYAKFSTWKKDAKIIPKYS